MEDRSPPRQDIGRGMRNGNGSRPQPGPYNGDYNDMRGPPPEHHGNRGPSRQEYRDRQGPPHNYRGNGPPGPPGRGYNGPPGPGYGPPGGRPGPDRYPSNGQQRSPPHQRPSE